MKILLKYPNILYLIDYFKEATLAHYLSKDQMKKHSGCDFEFDIKPEQESLKGSMFGQGKTITIKKSIMKFLMFLQNSIFN